MTKKRRTLSGFDQVASDIDNNNAIDNEKKVKNDAIKSIMKNIKTKDQTHTYKGFYLENKVADKIDEVTEGKPRGAMSELVNSIIKKYFQDAGLM